MRLLSTRIGCAARRLITAGSVAALVAAFAGACSSSPPPNSATLNRGSYYLPQAIADVANVGTGNTITFPASVAHDIEKLVPGNVMTAYRQSPGSSGNNPEGFMVKVVSVSKAADGSVTVTTAPDTLQDAFSKMNITQDIVLKEGIDEKAMSDALHVFGGTAPVKGTGTGSAAPAAGTGTGAGAPPAPADGSIILFQERAYLHLVTSLIVRGWPNAKLRELLPDQILGRHPELYVGDASVLPSGPDTSLLSA